VCRLQPRALFRAAGTVFSYKCIAHRLKPQM